MPRPTTATFWSSGSHESLTKVILICGSGGSCESTDFERLAERLERTSLSAVYCLDSASERLAESIAARHDLTVQPLSSSADDPSDLMNETAAANAGRTIVVVAEARINSALISLWLGVPRDVGVTVAQNHFAVNSVVFHGNRVVLETVNDLCHEI